MDYSFDDWILFVEWTKQLNMMVLTYNNDINYYYYVDDLYYSLSWYLLLVILNKILLIKNIKNIILIYTMLYIVVIQESIRNYLMWKILSMNNIITII